MEHPVLIINVILTLFWLVITCMCVLAQKRIRWLSPAPEPDHAERKISVIIPARNEETDIAASIHSVLNQKSVELEVIVVNDHSTDRTGEIVDDIARTDSRVTVIHNLDLPPGWLGKSNAMQKGAEAATGTYLLFTDADIFHAPGCFATVNSLVHEEAYDFLSLLPFIENHSFWENVNMPIYLFGCAKLLAIPGLEDSDSPNALASGALMFISARVFRDIGGFREIKGEVLDDVGLARLVKKQHYRVGVRIAPECLRVRLFKNNLDAFWGVTKNILVAVEGHMWLAIPLMILGILLSWTPLFAVALGILNSNGILLIVGVAAYGVQYLSFFSIRRLVRFRPLKALFFPLAAIVSTSCILRALSYRIKGAVYWRGREIKVKG